MSIKKEGYRMSINDLVLKVNDVLTGSVLIIALVGIGLSLDLSRSVVLKMDGTELLADFLARKGMPEKTECLLSKHLQQRLLLRLVPVISPELQLQLQSVVREQSSGCGSAHSSECQRSSQKRLWLRSSSRSVMTEP